MLSGAQRRGGACVRLRRGHDGINRAFGLIGFLRTKPRVESHRLAGLSPPVYPEGLRPAFQPEIGAGRRCLALRRVRQPQEGADVLGPYDVLLDLPLVVSVVRADHGRADGVGVSALLPGHARAAGVPHVSAVVTETGETLQAGLVADAGGGDSPVSVMLSDLRRVKRPAVRTDAGFDYYSRFFRSSDGTLPAQPAWLLDHHDSVSTLSLPSDNGTWSLTLVVSRRDWAMRSLYEEHVWDRAIALFPHLREWATYGEPITGVLTTAGPDTRRSSPRRPAPGCCRSAIRLPSPTRCAARRHSGRTTATRPDSRVRSTARRAPAVR
ncbi:hypothetical protein GCM10010404_91710 [Nonomuraea africana]